MKVACEKCGKEIDNKGIKNHLKFCKGKGPVLGTTPIVDNVPLEKRITDNPDNNDGYLNELWEGLDKASNADPPTIPLSLCPEMAYLHENRQYFFRVAGRKLGDRLVVEEVKLLING